MNKKERALAAVERLKAAYPATHCTLDYDEAWKLLVSVRLAAQCTDERVNRKTTELHADYGKNYGKMGLIEAQGNVIVQNFGSNETMYSDKLFWYQDTKMIHTRSHVKIVTPDKQIEADSLVAREDFSEYTMYSGSALLDVDEED